ncbi:calcium-binding protein [Microvirga sp. 2YAF29]|uniref:calcium-binding protein n=1 Tax=Microvirga sp. 2YAF29 TaxID=3233031 RepID=UPI003F9A87AC
MTDVLDILKDWSNDRIKDARDWSEEKAKEFLGPYEKQAEESSRQYGIKNDIPKNDLQKNAYFHAYVSALLAYDYGSTIASMLGTLREINDVKKKEKELETGKLTQTQFLNQMRDVQRDLHNNVVGRAIAEYAKQNGYTRDQLDDLVKEALDKGLLVTNEFKDPRVSPRHFDPPPAYKGPAPDSGIQPPSPDKQTQHLDRSLDASDASSAFGGRGINAGDAIKAALKAGGQASVMAATMGIAKQGAGSGSRDPGSNVPDSPSSNPSRSPNESNGGRSGSDNGPGEGGGNQVGPSYGGSGSSSGNGGGDNQGQGGGGSGGRGGSGGGDGGSKPGPGGTLDGGGSHGHGRDDRDMPGQSDRPSGGNNGGHGHDDSGVPDRSGPMGSGGLNPVNSNDDDGFFEGGFGGDGYAGIGPTHPIVLDLDGDGIDIVPLNKSQTYFDYNGDGAVGRTAWIGKGDGLLVFDADDSGTVNSAREFVFTQWSRLAGRDMFAVRTVFDTNKDDVLSSADTDFEKFKVWVDADLDGVTDSGELKTLNSLGLNAIPLIHNKAGVKYSDGSRIYGTATAKTTNGKQITVADVGLSIGTKNASIEVAQDGIDILPGDGTRKKIFNGAGGRAKAMDLGTSGYDAAFLKKADGTRLTAHYDTAGKIKSLQHHTANGRTIRSEVWTKDQESLMKFNKEATLTYWSMVGNSWDNIYRGSAETSVFSGGDGNDDLYGGGGNDTLDGGRGADQLDGEDGADSLDGGVGNDRLSGGEGSDDLKGQNGDDTLRGGAGDDTLNGGEGYDDLAGGAGNDVLQGGGGWDYLDGQEGNDTLNGGTSDDELRGGGDNDHLYGDTGDDMLFGEDGHDHLEGGDGRDELQGGAGNDTLRGGGDRDWLVGGAGQDVLHGDAGDDRLIGGDDNDHLLGGVDNDMLEGGGGRDTLDGGTGDDQLRGEAGDDVLSGEDGRDDLNGGEGSDFLSGGLGDDALLGEAGNDTLQGGGGNDALVGHGGDDILYGNEGDDLLKGNEGIDYLYGEAGADYLSGGSGNDIILAGDQDDQAYGDDDDDSIDGGTGSDKLWGGAGNDTLLGGLGHDVLTGDAGDDSLDGGAGDDMLSGGLGNDTLNGGGGSDQLFGGDGNDILVGGPDVDYIDGGTGTDVIVLTGNRTDYLIRFNTALGRFSIVDLRANSPDGTDLADIEIFRFADGDLTVAQLNYMTQTDAEIAYNVDNSDGSKSRIGWRPSAEDPSQIEAYIQRRNIAGTLMSETVFKPDGTRIARAWDVSSDGKGETWKSYTQNFDANAELVSQIYENDDGSFTLWQWDPDDVENWHDRETTYRNLTNYEQGLASRQFDTIDEGKLGVVDFIERLWDRAVETWDTVVREMNESKQTLIEITRNDNGSKVIKGWDYVIDSHNYRDGVNSQQADKQEWKTFEEHWDANQNKWFETYLYQGATRAEERTVQRGWDYNGKEWTSYELHMDGLLKSMWKYMLYDSGVHTITTWDHRVQGKAWEWQETAYLGDTRLSQRDQINAKAYVFRNWSNPDWTETEARYNDNGDLYYQHFIKGGRKIVIETDLADAYDWVEKSTTTENGITTRVETIYADKKIVEIFDHDGGEWTYRVQEWRGTKVYEQLNDKFYKGATLVKERKWDLANETWDFDEKHYHGKDVVYHKIIKDNETYTIDKVDYEGKDWDTISIKGRIINKVEKDYWKETLYTDSLQIIEQWDLGSEGWDTQISKSREYGGQRLTFFEGITFDVARTEGGRTYKAYFESHDRADVMSWWRVGMYAMGVDQGGDWAGWVQDDDMADNRGVIAADRVQKLKAWNGLDVLF